MYRTKIFVLTFLLTLLLTLSVVYGFDCSSIQTVTSDGKWNKTFLNCLSEPVLNISNVTNITQSNEIKIVNFTFNDTIISQAISNQTLLIDKYKTQVNELNYTQAILLIENNNLRNEVRNFNNLNPSYVTLLQMYNNSQYSLGLAQETISSTNQLLQSEKGNKLLYLIGGGIVGFVIFNFISRKQQQPEERLFPSGGRTKGEGEEIKTENIDSAINKKIKELQGKS